MNIRINLIDEEDNEYKRKYSYRYKRKKIIDAFLPIN